MSCQTYYRVCYNYYNIHDRKEVIILIVSKNVELSETIDRLVTDSGMKKRYISNQLGIPNQNFKRIIYKKNITLDDANKILRLIGYEAKIVIEKSQSKKN